MKTANNLFDMDYLYKKQVLGYSYDDIQKYQVDISSILSVNQIKKTPIMVI